MRLLLFNIVSFYLFSVSISFGGVLYDWNEAGNSDKTWKGWEYCSVCPDHSGAEGWSSDMNIIYDGTWYGPDMFEKNDNHYDKANPFNNTATIVDGYLGKGFKVYPESSNNSYRPGWWMWYTYDNLLTFGQGIADNNSDRLSFYIYLNDISGITKDGGLKSVPQRTLTFGAYSCWDDNNTDHCAQSAEGPGNQHYYHYAIVDGGAWWHVQLDQYPQTRRDGTNLPNTANPTLSEGGPSYWASQSKFYVEINYGEAQSQNSYLLIDEMEFWNQSQSENENIATVAIGFYPATGKWQISWHDMTFWTEKINLSSATHSTFEVRYSSTPITNTNYTSATKVSPEYYTGINYTGADNGLIRKPDSWNTAVWTQFELPVDMVQAGNIIYFAIKDMSDSGNNVGTTWPWSKADGRTATTKNIKTIEYKIKSEPLFKLKIENIEQIQ
jgi:hypothetical protein